MSFVDELSSYMESWKVPYTKEPIFTWSKKATKQECAAHLSDHDGYATHFWNPKTCVFGYELSDVTDLAPDQCRVITPCAKVLNGFYVSYIDSLDVVVLGKASLDAHAVHKNSAPRTWQRSDEIILCRDKSAYARRYMYCTEPGSSWYSRQFVYNADGSIKRKWTPWEQTEIVTCDTGFGVQSMENASWRYTGDSLHPYQHFDKAPTGVDGDFYRDFSGDLTCLFPMICNVGSNHFIDITKSAGNLAKFLIYKEPIGRDGPKARKIQDLVSKPVLSVPYDPEYPDKVAAVQAVEPGLCVFRTLFKNDEQHVMQDCARIYVGPKDIIACRPTNDGRWIDMRLNSNAGNWTFKLLPVDSEAVKGTRIAYLTDMLSIVSEEKRGILIWTMLMNPLVEQLAKAGGSKCVAYMIENMSSYSQPSDLLSHEFGPLGKSGGMLKRLGINSHQLQVALDFLETYYHLSSHDRWAANAYCDMIAAIKNMCASVYYHTLSRPYSIAWMDNDTFDNMAACYIAGTLKQHQTYNRDKYTEIMARISELYGKEKMFRMADKIALLTEDETMISFIDTPGITCHESYQSMYVDYLDMVKQLSDFTGRKPLSCDFDINDHHSIVEMHNAVVSVFNAQQNAAQSAKFSKAVKRCKKWEYNDGTYAILTPADPQNLVDEGINLHHCVGSYVNRVSDGITNIMFLRKVSDISVSFYTIEIGNKGTIEQIHGSCNKNLEPGTDDDVIQFVNDWVKKKKLKLTNYNKVR